MGNNHLEYNRLIKIIRLLIGVLGVMLAGILVLFLVAVFKPDIGSWFFKTNKELAKEAEQKEKFKQWTTENKLKEEAATYWMPAALNFSTTDSNLKEQVLYGKDLIINTAKYLGPKGTVLQISNGMNCQNCHLDAGTKIWGNNYGAVFSTYPKYRARSGKEEDIVKRINDCFERSLNGKALAVESREMQAIKSYIEFIGRDVQKGVKPKGSGIAELAFLDRAADPVKGNQLYNAKCQSCHKANGEGILNDDQIGYLYPPLWGKNSYNIGAGLYRNSRFAGYVKNNMPLGANFQNTQLTDAEAWDLAAFVNAQPRPSKDLRNDWPKIEEKPVDHPFGPFADSYAEKQHKFGPFTPIVTERKNKPTVNLPVKK